MAGLRLGTILSSLPRLESRLWAILPPVNSPCKTQRFPVASNPIEPIVCQEFVPLTRFQFMMSTGSVMASGERVPRYFGRAQRVAMTEIDQMVGLEIGIERHRKKPAVLPIGNLREIERLDECGRGGVRTIEVHLIDPTPLLQQEKIARRAWNEPDFREPFPTE